VLPHRCGLCTIHDMWQSEDCEIAPGIRYRIQVARTTASSPIYRACDCSNSQPRLAVLLKCHITVDSLDAGNSSHALCHIFVVGGCQGVEWKDPQTAFARFGKSQQPQYSWMYDCVYRHKNGDARLWSVQKRSDGVPNVRTLEDGQTGSAEEVCHLILRRWFMACQLVNDPEGRYSFRWGSGLVDLGIVIGEVMT
jgi:hypothetical protein